MDELFTKGRNSRNNVHMQHMAWNMEKGCHRTRNDKGIVLTFVFRSDQKIHVMKILYFEM